MLNAANEVAVAAFLDERIGFPAIAAVNGDVLSSHVGSPAASSQVRDLADAREADAWARQHAQERLTKHRPNASAGDAA